MRSTLLVVACLTLATLVKPVRGVAQHTDHAAHHAAARDSLPAATQSRQATLPGQDAFAAIAEIVRILRADPATDWAKVTLEALREHLIDMHDVTLNSVVRGEPIAGGVQLTVSGVGRTRDAIQRMVAAHTPMLAAEGLDGILEKTPQGVRWRVTTNDTKRLDEVRALGFIGILTLGEHHTSHHLMLARGGGHH
ncbi:MAG: hypothetical protein IT359_13945 [Gemmatimonadaceae bacterium]|nr:hypothetical protein [Gemmatimonadaceae bacterium]